MWLVEGQHRSEQKGIRWMRLSHGSPALSATFDDPNLVSAGGLTPVVALAQSCRLGDLIPDKLTLKATGGVNAALKVPALVAGMVAGADAITDMGLLRHGGMGGCSPRSGRRRRWARFCGRSPSATSVSSTRWPRRC